MPPVHLPLRRLAAILSRTRSDDSSRSNWAKDKKHVEGQPAHRRGGIELLGDGDERDRSGVKGLDQFGEVGERAGEAVDLVDHDHVDLAGLDIGQQLLQGRAVEVAAGIGGVVIVLGKGLPAL